MADKLSSSPANILENMRDSKVHGYICQNGANVKLKRLEGDRFEIVAYYGDPITGESVSYYHILYPTWYVTTNPYQYYNSNRNDLRYKSDLDGGFRGLNLFHQMDRYRYKTNEEESEDIRARILNGQDLNRYRR